MVQGVEIILAIFSIIKGPKIDIEVISNFLKNKFSYNLPVFIETIYKLNQLIDFINDPKENKLEETLIKEMEKENDLNNFLYNNIIILKVNDEYEKIKANKEAMKAEDKKEEKEKDNKKEKEESEEEEEKPKLTKFKKERIKNLLNNIKKSLEIDENKKKEKKEKKNDKKTGESKEKKQIKKEIPKVITKPIKEQLIDIIKEFELLIVNADNDILEFEFDNMGKKEKYIGITFDGFILSNKNLKEPEIKKEEEVKKEEVKEEEPFWLCYYCQMENDKNNTFCVFCDKDKKVLVKEKPKPKPVEEKIDLGIPDNYSTVLKYNEKKMNNLIKKLKSLEIEEHSMLH